MVYSLNSLSLQIRCLCPVKSTKLGFDYLILDYQDRWNTVTWSYTSLISNINLRLPEEPEMECRVFLWKPKWSQGNQSKTRSFKTEYHSWLLDLFHSSKKNYQDYFLRIRSNRTTNIKIKAKNIKLLIFF